jgi:hypothetical protein
VGYFRDFLLYSILATEWPKVAQDSRSRGGA